MPLARILGTERSPPNRVERSIAAKLLPLLRDDAGIKETVRDATK